MQRITIFSLALLILGLASGCVPTGLVRDHQNELDCPRGLDDYCGGWSVFTRDVKLSSHIEKFDSFVIGRKNTGQNAGLALFPRAELRARWRNQGRVPLREVRVDGAHDCLVGRVRVLNHSNAAPPQVHEWHTVTLRTSEKPDPEIGVEVVVDICMNPQDGGSWPTACAPIAECKYPDDDDPRNHGGRAHAHD